MPTYSNKAYIELMRPLPDFVARDVYGIPFIEPENIGIYSVAREGIAKSGIPDKA